MLLRKEPTDEAQTMTYPCLHRRAFVCQEDEIEMAGLLAIEGEAINTLIWIGQDEIS